jgi:hypothetical protein
MERNHAPLFFDSVSNLKVVPDENQGQSIGQMSFNSLSIIGLSASGKSYLLNSSGATRFISAWSFFMTLLIPAFGSSKLLKLYEILKS